VKPLGRLAELKLAMGTSIFLVAFIFALFLSAIMLIIQLSFIYAIIGTVIFILIEYLIGPAIVKSSTSAALLGKRRKPMA
jgi:antibiotic biosynthesis monooxygenase (ABM) superfamily enzyme